LWDAFRDVVTFLGDSPSVMDNKRIELKWSAGQGRWATIPWIAMLDKRETTRMTAGVYVVYLFREDMTGFYLTLNQGSTDVLWEYRHRAFDQLKLRAKKLAKPITTELEGAGFVVGSPIDLRATKELGRAYQAGAVAHKFYSRTKGAIPTGPELREDLAALLGAYQSLIPSKKHLELP